MSKNQHIANLYLEFKAECKTNGKTFIKDGIVDEDEFEKQNPKLLFIGKEANYDNPNESEYNYRSELRSQVKHRYNHRIAEWSYGIQNDFPPFDQIYCQQSEEKKAIKKVAVIEINKTGGRGKSDKQLLSEGFNKTVHLVKKEIEIIKPDIIISGLYDKSLLLTLFPNINLKSSGYYIQVAKYYNFKVINFYHPSSQSVPAALYSFLQNVIRSNVFKNL